MAQLRKPIEIRVVKRATHYTTDFVYSPTETTIGRRAFFTYIDVMDFCNQKWAGVPITRVYHDQEETQ